ncbi:MAG: hypothetical protein RLZZ574_1387, partial [Cyanobacteriota bacterium]
MHSLKAVIFDMDGVVINSQSIADKLLMETASSFGVVLTREELQRLHGTTLKQFWSYLKLEYKLPETVEFYVAQYDVDREIAAYNLQHLVSGAIHLSQLIDFRNWLVN